MMPAAVEKGGLVLQIRLTPKSSADEVVGVEQWDDGIPRLKVRVRAAPENGKANAALIKTVAHWLGVAKTSVTVKAGAQSRFKSLLVTGDSNALLEVLDERLASLRS